MLNTTDILINSLVGRIAAVYERDYGLDPSNPGIACWAARMALENIANSDALYHNVEHTALVTLVGLEILRGKHIIEGGVTPSAWLHCTIALLCHDIGYVRGVCRQDDPPHYVTGKDDETVELPRGATDASLTPYHVDRGQRFIRDRFGGHALIDAEAICRAIEHTRFPVPSDDDHATTVDLPGLVRAADLIGQLADPRYINKLPALFHEFQETGTATKLGYESADDLRDKYPGFFWNVVRPFIDDGVRYLNVTQEGKMWIASLYRHVFELEHAVKATG